MKIFKFFMVFVATSKVIFGMEGNFGDVPEKITTYITQQAQNNHISIVDAINKDNMAYFLNNLEHLVKFVQANSSNSIKEAKIIAQQSDYKMGFFTSVGLTKYNIENDRCLARNLPGINVYCDSAIDKQVFLVSEACTEELFYAIKIYLLDGKLPSVSLQSKNQLLSQKQYEQHPEKLQQSEILGNIEKFYAWFTDELNDYQQQMDQIFQEEQNEGTDLDGLIRKLEEQQKNIAGHWKRLKNLT
ncbi:MAG: hypothetical protein ACTSXG_01840 [Alphaproteobacteria bacterium]